MVDWKKAIGISQDTLSVEEISFLAQQGYLNLGKILSTTEVERINQRIAVLADLEGEAAGSELADSKYIRHPKEAGADRLADLVNKGSVFDVFYSHPKVLAGIAAVLGDQIKLSSLNYRAAKPGMGLQKLHVDWKDGLPHGQYRVCNSIWLLDDFTARNGATRVVPGSHLWDKLPQDEMPDQEASHPDEILIQGAVGSVFIFNSHTWHGGTTNQTDKLRRSMHSYFCTRDQNQQVDQRRYILPETKTRLADAACYLLDIN